ncbi:carbonic anhydrase, partial [Streptomyces sp. NPDC059455]|uniref:carbonic anhydrase n=1 Tax=Streptomyces sp. NPDC059455 TaxID=3346837 RepID=UPI0036A4FF47
MQNLIDQARVFPARAAAHGVDLNRLADGQRPRALFIACSDARVVPALIAGSRPGDLLELRNHGGIIPHYRPHSPHGESRTIKFAVNDLKVSHIVVCGHSHCEIVNAFVHDGSSPRPGTPGQPKNTLTGTRGRGGGGTNNPRPPPRRRPGGGCKTVAG